MKDSLSSPVRYNKVIIIEAILLTIGIHLLFFYLFSIPEVRRHNTEKENTTVTLLRFAEGDNATQKMEKFIQQYNPGHFAGTKSPIGYNTLRSVYTRKSVQLPPLDNDNLQIKADNAENDFSLPVNKSKKIPLPKKEISSIGNVSVQKTTYPFAVSSSGIVIQLTFSTDEQRLINEFPLSAGIYKIFKPAGSAMPRIALLQSCGRRALDQLSLKSLYQEISKLSACTDGEILTVFYREPETPGGIL